MKLPLHMVCHGVSFVFKLYLVYFYNLTVWILFIVLYLPVCVRAFVSVFEHAGLWGGGCVHDVAFGVTRTLCVVCAVVCGGERQGDTAWFRPGMCDVGRLYNRAGLPEGGQWDGCHPPAPSPLGDDHHTTLQLSGPLNHHCKHTYIMGTNTHVSARTRRDIREHAGTRVLKCILCRRNDMNTHTQLSYVHVLATCTKLTYGNIKHLRKHMQIPAGLLSFLTR